MEQKFVWVVVLQGFKPQRNPQKGFMLFSYIIGPKYGGAGGGSRNLVSRVEVQHNKPLYDTRKFGQNQTRSVYRDLVVNKLPYQSVPRHYCEPGGSRTLNPKNFRLKKACLPISPQVLIVAGQVGFEPTPSKLTVSSINHCATDHYICFEVSNGFEPLSLGYKARIISHYTKRPIKSVISLC